MEIFPNRVTPSLHRSHISCHRKPCGWLPLATTCALTKLWNRRPLIRRHLPRTQNNPPVIPVCRRARGGKTGTQRKEGAARTRYRAFGASCAGSRISSPQNGGSSCGMTGGDIPKPRHSISPPLAHQLPQEATRVVAACHDVCVGQIVEPASADPPPLAAHANRNTRHPGVADWTPQFQSTPACERATTCVWRRLCAAGFNPRPRVSERRPRGMAPLAPAVSIHARV